MTSSLIDRILTSLPRRITRVDCGVGSLLMIDHGAADSDGLLTINKTWIYLCDWRIFVNDKILIDSDHDFSCELIVTKLDEILVGESLVDVSINCGVDLIKIDITNRKSIVLTSDTLSYEESDDMVSFYFSNSDVVSYSPDKKLYCENKNSLD